MKRRLALTATAAAAAAAAAGTMVAVGDQAAAHDDKLHAVLRDPNGARVGTVTFSIGDDHMRVKALLQPNKYVAADAFHGFHVHANNDTANGAGCLADPAQPSTTWFVSADGHLAETGQTHGHHDGDLPSVLVLADGTAVLRFTVDRIDPDELKGRAVVLHAGPDNFGNVPTGAATDQYTPNAPAATDKTQKTGNAGDRVACGVVHRR